jgi:hypothetical protein
MPLRREQIVEAMARAMLDERQRAIKERYRHTGPVAGWDGIAVLTQEEIRQEASAALDAALPLLVQAVLEDTENSPVNLDDEGVPISDRGADVACETLASFRTTERAS